MIYQKENYYHVFNRGCGKESIFQSDSDYRKLINKMKLTKDLFEIEIIAFCLIPNHYHFILYQISDIPISNWLRDIFNSYVQSFNLKYKRTGTLFERNAQPRLITSDEYLIDAVHYVHANPLKHNLVIDPNDWEFSSFLEYQSGKMKMASRRVLDVFFHSEYSYMESFKAFLESRKFDDELEE
ncbi:MAG: transposase [Candidatus Cloacimonadales bacterium]|nr:transposase [Candidatus Cloacimonadales bacterium]